MLNENTQMMIKNDNSMSKLESTCDHNSIRPCHCSFTLQTFANMGTELNSGSLHSDTMITHPVSESANSGVCLISSNPLRSSEIPQPLSPYHHSVHQTFNLPSNSIQELHISAVSQSVFPGQIPAVIPAAVNSSNLSLSPLLFHPPGPYILPNPSSANLSPAHLQTVNPQISNIPLNSEYKNLSPSGILEATLHNSVPLVTGPIDGSAANPIKPVSDSQSVGTNKGTNENGNYYVMVHVDAGETFSVRVGDQIQHIPGPATVRMVSNSGPPLPMPMQVPPGHLVQQIVDEEGILTHVILSPYPTPPLPMVATGVPMSISQTNDVSTAGANLILNPNQHLQPHHHHHRHLHPLLTSPGIPSNEGLIHINPYASQHPQPIPGHSIHPFPPPPFIHPHFPHFHQQFHVHSAHPHVCGIADGDSNVSTKYPITSEIIDDKTHCDTSICRSTYLVNEFSDSPYANPYSKENIVKEIPDSTTMNDNHNSGDNNHSSDLSSTHSDPVTVNEFHSVIDGCYESTKSDIDEISFLPNKKSYVPGSSSIMDSSSNNKLKNLQSSKCSSDQINGFETVNGICDDKPLNGSPTKMSSKCKYESNTAIEEEAANTITSTCGLCDHNDIINCNEAVGSSCNTSSSLITADSSSKTDVKHSENRDHISMRYKYALNGNTMVNSDYCKPTNTTTTTTTTTSTNISTIFTTSSSCITKTSTILTPTNTSTSVIDSGHTSSGVNTLSSYSSSYPPATFPSHRRRRGGGINGAMHATSGGANNNNNNNSNNSNNNNKNYSSFRSHNRPANFGFNKSLQNSVWNHHQSATSVASKSHSDYHHHHHHDGLQNSINNNQTSHYQQHHPSPVYYQPHPHYHRGSISGATGGGGGPTQDLDMDSEMENEKACATDMSTCSLPVNVLLPTVQSPSSYCSQSDRLLNSQCYSHHHHHQVHQHLQPYDAYMNKGFGSNTNGAMSVGNDTIITNEHEDIDLTTTNVGWSTQDRIIHNLLSNILSPQVTEVKSHSALIQLSFPQDLIHSSIVTPETETSLLTTTTTTDINCTSTSAPTSITTLVTGTLPLITATTTTTTKAKSIPTLSSDNGLSSLTESNSNNDTVNSYKATYSPSKNLHNEYKPSSSSSLTTTTPIATTALSTTKRNLSKGDISNHSATNNDNNSNNNENDEYGSANDELNANSNITTSNTDTNNDNINQNEQYQLTIDLDAIQFELHLTERCSTPQFKCVFIGEATFISLQDLRPGTNYYVKVCCNYSGIRGDFSPVAHFITLPSQPSPPRTIQIICQTRNSLHIKWGPGIDNGSRITSYKLEYAQVSTNSSEIGLDKNQDPEFFEPIQVFGRSYKINQLSPSTEYLIRVAAINQYGQSSWSPILSASTSGSPPDMPLPPFLIQADVHSLTLGWRPPTNLSDQYQYHNHHHHDITCDQTNSSSYMNHLNPITYTLEMDDQAMGHGFVTVFDGTGTEHCIDNLRRNTRYRFRLAASNVDGRSRWSETITLTTLPDHPSPPRNLRIYGSLLQPTRLAITWDVPEDDGGMPIQAYRLEALLPYSNSNNNNTSLVNGTLTNGSNTKLNDGTYSLEKIDDHMDVIKKLICWPHVTALKPGAPILSAINSSCSPNIISANTSSSSAAITTTTANVVDENYLVNNYDSNHKITSDMTNGNRKYQSRIFEMDSNVIDCTKSTENAQNNNNDNNGTTTSITTISPTITTSTAHNTDYDLELNYSHTAWFIIYEGPEKELLIENLPPGFCLQLRVRASCSLTDNTNPLCSAFSSTSSSSSSSSSVSSGRVSVLNLHNYSTDMSYSLARSKTVGMNAAVTTTTTTATANTSATTTSVGGGTTGSGGLWGMANCPPLKIRMPPIPPSAPCSGPRLVGKPKPTSLHLCWSPPKQTGGAPILAYEVWQLTLEPTSWIDEESEDNQGSNLSIQRYCSSTPSSSLETSFMRSSCHNLEYDPNLNKYLTANSCQPNHRQPFHLYRSYTDPSLNMKSYALNSDNIVKLNSLFNDSSLSSTGRFVCSVHETECRLLGLIPGQNYAFRVRAYNCAGKGLWTEWISLSTPPSLPGVPTCPPRLLPKSSRTVHISWDPVTCINGAKIYEYRLEYRQYYTSFNSTDYYNVGHASNIPSEKTVICNSFCTSLDSSSGIDSTEQADSDSFFQLIYAGPKLSFELTDLQPATLFAFRFCAVNTAGAGPWSPIAKCWTPSAPPDQPHGLCIHDLNSDSALILWVAPQCNGSPITSYTIEITQFGHIKSNNKSASGNRIMPLYPDVNYIQIPAPCLSNYNNNQIMNSIAKQQHPFLSVMDTSTTTVGANTTATTTHNNSNNNTQSQKKMIQHYLSKLKPSTTYILRIQAVNKFGPSEYSANIEFTTLAPLPRPPVFSQYTNLSSNTVKLEWNLSVNPIDSDGDTDCIDKIKGEDKEDEGNNEKLHVNDTTSSSPHHHGQQQTKMRKQKMDIKSEESQITFTLQISREPDLEWTTIYEGQANVHKVNRLCEFTVYHFRVCATNTTGSGSYSTIQTIRTQKSSPPAVRGLKILELSPDRCQLEWTPVNQLGMDPIVYLLHLLPVSCNPQQSSNLNQVYRGNQSACRITGLNPGSEYVCRVCAVRLCQPNKLPVVINGSPDNEQSKVNSSTDSSQYQITELPGPFSPGLVFTTPRPHKDSRCDSTLPNYHLFQQHSSCKQSSLLRILSLPFRTIRRMYSCGGSSNTSAYSTHDSSSSITPTKHDMIHSNQVIATGTSTSSSLVNNASDKRRTVLVSATSSSSSSVLMATIPRNQSKQSSSRRSHSSWFRFTDTQLACLLLILFSLATLLVAMSLQYVLNIHLKISNHPSASSSIDSSYEVKLRNNEDNSDSSLFIASTDNDYDHFREYHP